MVSIRITNLAHEYEDREVFSSINFGYEGSCLAITGHNGSGKSTLVKIIAGLLTPSCGEANVLINGSLIPRSCLRDIVGLVALDVRLYPELTTRENLSFLLEVRALPLGKDRIPEVLEEVGLSERADDPVRELSTGLRQRANFAAALLHKPVMLLLDEPSSNLDTEGVQMVLNIIKRQQSRGMVVLATNDSNEAALGNASLNLGAQQ